MARALRILTVTNTALISHPVVAQTISATGQANGVGGVLTGYTGRAFSRPAPATCGVELGFKF